jgi:hypothetical protein
LDEKVQVKPGYDEGKIVRKDQDGTYAVSYEDGTVEEKLESSQLVRCFTVGQKLKVRQLDPPIRFIDGVVTRKNDNTTYDFEYFDGTTEKNVSSSRIVRPEDLPAEQQGAGAGTAKEHDRLSVGTAVEVRFNSAEWLSGTIAVVRLDGTYDVSYKNGETQKAVQKSDIRVLPKPEESVATFEEGSLVEANYRGRGRFFPGKIQRVRADGAYDIIYDDKTEEMQVAADNIRLREGNEVKQPIVSGGANTMKPKFEEGSKVEANYRDRGRFFPGKVRRVREEGTYDIDYDDGENELKVNESNIRSLEVKCPSNDKSKFTEGSKVEVNFRGKGRYYPGKIRHDRGDGTYDIDYDDGEIEKQVKESNIRLLGEEPKFPVGSKVEAQSRGMPGKYYPGTIDRVQGDGTYGISFDDESFRSHVPESDIRLLPDKSDKPPLEEGSRVEANYRGKGRYFPGKVKGCRLDGTFDIVLTTGIVN